MPALTLLIRLSKTRETEVTFSHTPGDLDIIEIDGVPAIHCLPEDLLFAKEAVSEALNLSCAA